MKIGGFQGTTLLDYPQKVAAIIFASGCNMRCPFCYNPDLVFNKTESMPEELVWQKLEQKKKYLDGLVITGGEPTCQSDLSDFCRRAKNFGYEIKLDTNGLLPEVLSRLIDDKLVDYLAMDIKAPLERYQEVAGVELNPFNIEKSIGLIFQSGLPYEFRSTLVKGFHRAVDVEKMTQMISGAENYFLQNFHRPGKLVGENFSGGGFSSAEMEKFKSLAEKFVKHCGVRGNFAV